MRTIIFLIVSDSFIPCPHQVLATTQHINGGFVTESADIILCQMYVIHTPIPSTMAYYYFESIPSFSRSTVNSIICAFRNSFTCLSSDDVNPRTYLTNIPTG